MPLMQFNRLRNISIHALREEGDSMCLTFAVKKGNFYPRPPRGGRRLPRQGRCPDPLISIHALREEGDPSHHF